MYSKLEKLVAHIPILQKALTKTATQITYASQVLKDADQHTAVGLFMAVRTLYGIEVLDWEPETLWLTLDKDGYTLEEESRNKIQAAITLILNPSFYWDSIVYQQTVQAFNAQPFDPEALQEPAVAHMCWAVYEANAIRGLDPADADMIPEFDEDVQMFTAVVLKRAGYLYPPSSLQYCDLALKTIYAVDPTRIDKEIAKAWKAIDKKRLEDTTFAETPVGIQLSKLATNYLYVQDNAELLAEELLSFRLSVPSTSSSSS